MSSRLNRRPFQGHGSRGPASRGAEMGDSCGRSNLAHWSALPVSNRLAFPKPNDGMKITSRGAVWTTALVLSDFPLTRHVVM